MSFADINLIITIEKKGGSPVDYEAEIYNYSESNLTRKVDYTKVIGGLILPRTSTEISKTVSFDFIIEDFDFIKLINDTETNEVNNFDVFNEFKISLRFQSGTNYYSIVYYNAMVEELTHMSDNDVIKGTIGFSLPMKNINGDSNYYLFDTSTGYTSKDATMGY